ncbi:MAG: ABC-2 family transporter protein [Myxococcales bacterium]|nr:ABC-2 family transporter protein [Myxococcales bacterium]MCB9702499.1 ABC-2 family transporter protein [Myxococcales bacterium]
MAGLRSALRVAGAQLRLSVLAALEYRVGFWSDGVLGVLWSLIGVVPLLVAIDHRPEVAGWSAWELMVLTGCFMAVSGIFGAFLQPALLASMEHVRRGTLDYLLLRPANALGLCLAADFSPWRLTELVVGLGLVAYSLVELGVRPAAGDLLRAAAAFGAGIVALYALGILALAASFRALQLQNLTYLFEALLDFARWPASVFGGLLRALFTFVVPFAVMTTLPAEGLLDRLEAGALGGALATALVLLALASLAWGRALRGYTSASS